MRRCREPAGFHEFADAGHALPQEEPAVLPPFLHEPRRRSPMPESDASDGRRTIFMRRRRCNAWRGCCAGSPKAMP